jgi:hypothetical protein
LRRDPARNRVHNTPGCSVVPAGQKVHSPLTLSARPGAHRIMIPSSQGPNRGLNWGPLHAISAPWTAGTPLRRRYSIPAA